MHSHSASASSFAYLLLANFLFVDTFFEYLGCRMTMIKVGDEHSQARVGWNTNTELSSYMCAALLGAVLSLAFLLIPLVGDGVSSDAPLAEEEQSSLLPLSKLRASEDGELQPLGGSWACAVLVCC